MRLKLSLEVSGSVSSPGKGPDLGEPWGYSSGEQNLTTDFGETYLTDTVTQGHTCLT